MCVASYRTVNGARSPLSISRAIYHLEQKGAVCLLVIFLNVCQVVHRHFRNKRKEPVNLLQAKPFYTYISISLGTKKKAKGKTK